MVQAPRVNENYSPEKGYRVCDCFLAKDNRVDFDGAHKDAFLIYHRSRLWVAREGGINLIHLDCFC